MSASPLAEFGSPASGHAEQPDTFDTQLRVSAAFLPSGTGQCTTPVHVAHLTRAATAPGGGIPLADCVADRVAADEGHRPVTHGS